jgi:integrase
VALSRVAANALRSHRERQEADFVAVGRPFSPDTLVFERADGTTPVPGSVTHAFAKYAKRAGVTGVHLHNLRHTLASRLAAAGIGADVVAKALGHSSAAFTLDVYTYAAPEYLAVAARKFDEVMAREAAVSKSEARSAIGQQFCKEEAPSLG